MAAWDGPDEASILLEGEGARIRFFWGGFDGDDGFSSHHLEAREGSATRRYDFGPCAVKGLKKLTRFLETADLPRVSLGFRNPDIMSYDVARESTGFVVTVTLQDEGVREVRILRPAVTIDRRFIDLYTGGPG